MRQAGRRGCPSVTYPWTRPLFCSCWSRMFSSFRGLGMKPISQPSFTNRPIHQSLLNFWTPQRKKKKRTGGGKSLESKKAHIDMAVRTAGVIFDVPLLCGGNPWRQRRWRWLVLEHPHPVRRNSWRWSSQRTPQVWSSGWKHATRTWTYGE